MFPTEMLITAVILLPAVGLAIWAWLSMARFEADLRNFAAFEKSHFEIGLQAAKDPEGARWAIPG